jgi:glyoxylase-like metal-dependent hydrolase (beta-lactamase superfamily II)
MKVAKVLAAVAGGVVLVLGGLLGFVFSQMSANQGARVDAAGKAVGVLAGMSYAWVVPTAHGALVVDTGDDDKGEALLAELKARNVAPTAVHTVLITHAHGDHTHGLQHFPNAHVVVGPGESPYIKGEAFLGPSWMAKMQKPIPVPRDLVEAHDGDTLDVDGVAIRVVHVPGHTPGSLMYLMGDLLFTGDSLMMRKGKLQMGPNFFSESVEDNRRSLGKLTDVPFTAVADGHSGYTADAKPMLAAFLSAP